MPKRICLLLIAVFLLNFCLPVYAQDFGGSSYFVGDAIKEAEYKLGPGDQVAANLIIGNSDMSLDYAFTVDSQGKIFFPKVGEIKLLGLTIPKAKKVINSRIRSIYKEKYSFSFRLVAPRGIRIYLTGSEDKPLYFGEKQFISVYGEVTRKGRFQYLPGKKFSDYISYAGGPAPRANLNNVTITRGKQKFRINASDVIFNGDTSKDITIMPGDVINVPGNFFYFTDFASFANTILLALTLYTSIVR